MRIAVFSAVKGKKRNIIHRQMCTQMCARSKKWVPVAAHLSPPVESCWPGGVQSKLRCENRKISDLLQLKK